jgi:hypothetical protein
VTSRWNSPCPGRKLDRVAIREGSLFVRDRVSVLVSGHPDPANPVNLTRLRPNVERKRTHWFHQQEFLE